MKIKLDGVAETLLIPLAAKAWETRRKSPRIVDRDAVEMMGKIDYDFSKFDKPGSKQGVIARSMILDREVQKYADTYADAVCICIGCGLDTRYERIHHGKMRWYNLDFPEVIRLRKQLLREGKNVSCISKSALNPDWTSEVAEQSEHVLILLEGILMYFTELEVMQLLCIIKNKFSNATILAEIMHPMMVKQSKHHDTIKSTNATFHWGIKSGKEMEKLCDRLRFEKEWNLTDELLDQGILFNILGRIPFIRDKNDKIVKLKVCSP
ncbi:MAG: class I SAM-dependent methyltransferase [Lachnospiraceae bacterium]|nr:class I SAM-dependent methyltransferase [Lachnospiraceae bacterium]